MARRWCVRLLMLLGVTASGTVLGWALSTLTASAAQVPEVPNPVGPVVGVVHPVTHELTAPVGAAAPVVVAQATSTVRAAASVPLRAVHAVVTTGIGAVDGTVTRLSGVTRAVTHALKPVVTRPKPVVSPVPAPPQPRPMATPVRTTSRVTTVRRTPAGPVVAARSQGLGVVRSPSAPTRRTAHRTSPRTDQQVAAGHGSATPDRTPMPPLAPASGTASGVGHAGASGLAVVVRGAAVDEHGGRIPVSRTGLRAFPGIRPGYTPD